MSRKIIITGSTCTGKTTLGEKLSKELEISQVDLDNFYFLPNWTEKSNEQFVKDVNEAISNLDEWIITGSYQTLLKDTVWKYASTIVWLDYSFSLVIRRFFIRTYKRVFYKEKCCGENYETLARVFSSKSLFLWIFKSFWRRRERMRTWEKGVFSHKNWIILTKPKEEHKLINLL